MLAKRTAKTQLIPPKAIVQTVGSAEYFDVSVENGRIVPTLARLQRVDAVRAKLAELNLTEKDLEEAIAWARQPR